jgi:hypothetical protein
MTSNQYSLTEHILSTLLYHQPVRERGGAVSFLIIHHRSDLLCSVSGLHCNCNSLYIFLFWELRGLSPNFHIHVSVNDLYIPRISPHISSSRKGRPIVAIYNSLKYTWMWKLGLILQYSFSGNICLQFSVSKFQFSAFCLCSVLHDISGSETNYLNAEVR